MDVSLRRNADRLERAFFDAVGKGLLPKLTERSNVEFSYIIASIQSLAHATESKDLHSALLANHIVSGVVKLVHQLGLYPATKRLVSDFKPARFDDLYSAVKSNAPKANP